MVTNGVLDDTSEDGWMLQLCILSAFTIDHFEISNSLMFRKEQLYFEPGATVTSTSFSW